MKQVWAHAALSTCSLWSTVENPEKLWVKNIYIQNISPDFLAELVIPNGLIPLSLDHLFTELDCSKKNCWAICLTPISSLSSPFQWREKGKYNMDISMYKL